MLHLFKYNLCDVCRLLGTLSEIFAYCIFTFHTPEKPKQALSQFLSVCQYLTPVDEFFVCTFHGETNAFTNFNGTFSFSFIHAWKGYFKMSYAFWNEWRLFKYLLWYGFGHNFSPLCSCGYIQNLIVFGCYVFYIIILKFCISNLGIERLLFRFYSFQSWRGVRSSCAGVGTSFTMSCLSCLSWFA